MFLCELYQSRQGEGKLTGVESVFVRTSGCNLRCWFCDTAYSSWHPEGAKQSVHNIVEQCADSTCRHVVITGGEPMLQHDIVELTRELHALEFHITIETAGTIFQPVTCDLMSISPKLSNSTPSMKRAGAWYAKHEQTRDQPEVVRRLASQFEYQFKFVIDQAEDCQEVLNYLAQFPRVLPEHVYLMPQGTTTGELESRGPWIAEFCRENDLNYCPRKHIEWFGHKRGT